MDVRDNPNHDDGLPPRKPPKKRARKNELPIMPRPSLPAEAEGPFGQLMDMLMHDDMDIRCRAILWVKENGAPQVMQRILYEIQIALHSRSQAVRDKASTLLFFLAPRIFGFPPRPLSLDELTKRLGSTDPEVRRKAAEAIGDMGKAAQPAVGLLHQLLLQDPDPKVEFQAAVAIGQITGQMPEKAPAQSKLELLKIVLSE